MNSTRLLRFEVMEPRIALSANASEMFADLQANITAKGLDPQTAQEMLAQLVQSNEDSPTIRTTPPSLGEWGDKPIVQFRIDICDLQDRPVTTVHAGGEYLAKVFVQDMRDLTSTNPDEHGNGGVFQAWVDLEFSPNLHPTGSVRVNEAFSSPKLDPETDGSFLRNLGGVKREFTPFGDAEQFLLETRFVVDSTDTPNRIQVVPSTSQLDPVLLFGFASAVPAPNIASPALELQRETNIDSTGSSRAPLIDPLDDSTTKFPLPTPPVVVLPNSEDHSPEAGPEVDSIALVSYIPFFRDSDFDAPSRRRDKDDRWRSDRRDDGKNHANEWKELEWPDEADLSLDARSLSRSELQSTGNMNPDDEEEEGDLVTRQSNHTGLFYDEALFLEGALVRTFQSKFRLHLQIFSPQRQSHEHVDESFSNNDAKPQPGRFVDIADILTPHQDPNPWQDNVDEAIAGNHHYPSQAHRGPTTVWGSIEPAFEDRNAPQRNKQADAKQKLPDQRIPLAMNQPVTSTPETGPTPTVQ